MKTQEILPGSIEEVTECLANYGTTVKFVFRDRAKISLESAEEFDLFAVIKENEVFEIFEDLISAENYYEELIRG